LRIILGTATFGTKYGVSNFQREQNTDDVLDILQRARDVGVLELDTAPEYAKAEEIIGNFHLTDPTFGAYSKILNLPGQSCKAWEISISKSMKSLKVPVLEGVYFHRPENLNELDKNQVNEFMSNILESGRVRRFGASVYCLNEVERLLESFPKITLFQVPENILDRRMLNSTLLENMAANGHEILVRSVFLQGLLLMEPNSVPDSLSGTIPRLLELRKFSEEKELTVLESCLSYLKLLKFASGYLVGISNANQLSEIIYAKLLEFQEDELPSKLESQFLDPRTWRS
jgi:aryl-alcohol dehydrogenase-like predicted oxidoreductase